jgi:hypothetical protein
MMFHPSHRVPDLGIAKQFFGRVFGRESKMMYEVVPQEMIDESPGYPRDYCHFTAIQDVFFDTIDPKRYVIDGVQRYPDSRFPHLNSLGWYVEDPVDVYARLGDAGVRCFDQRNQIAVGPNPPMSAARPMYLYWAVPDDAGLAYEFFPADQRFPGDDRPIDGWQAGAADPDDPLGIVQCASHTILTDQPDRAQRLALDVLGGEIVAESQNESLGTISTFVHLAGSTLEYAQPIEPRTAAMKDLQDQLPGDCYHSVTWQVEDLDRAAAHLESCGVRLRTRTESLIVTDPETSIGIPWGFTEELLEGDPRTG